MKNFKLLILFLLPVLIYGQSGDADNSNVLEIYANFMLKADATSFSIGGGSDMTGTLTNGNNITSSYLFNLSGVQAGMTIVTGSGYIYEISTVSSVFLDSTGWNANVEIKQLTDVFSTSTLILPTGTVLVSKPTNQCGLIPVQSVETNSLSPAIMAYANAYNLARIDSCIIENSGASSEICVGSLEEMLTSPYQSNCKLFKIDSTNLVFTFNHQDTTWDHVGGELILSRNLITASPGKGAYLETDGTFAFAKSDTFPTHMFLSTSACVSCGEEWNIVATGGRYPKDLFIDWPTLADGQYYYVPDPSPANTVSLTPDSDSVRLFRQLGEYIYVNVGTSRTGGASSSGGGGSNAFDSNRPILRVPTVGVNIGGSTVNDFLEYWYFSAPTISLGLSPSTTVYEVGTSNAITLSGSTTNSGGSTLSNGNLNRTVPGPSTSINSFAAATTYSQPITFAPNQTPSGDYTELDYSFQAEQDYSGDESGTATSTTRSIKGIYPVFYGMSATDLSSTGDPYTVLTKLVEDEGDKTVTFTGTNEFMYYAFPVNWADNNLSQILDHNGFDVTSSFTEFTITVGSTGLTNNWTGVFYRLYKLNSTTTASGFDYQFIR